MVSGRLKQPVHSELSGRLRAAREFVLFLCGARKRYRVANNSMLPDLKPGDFLLMNQAAYRRTPPQIGDVVLALHPGQSVGTVVKRVAHSCDDQVWLLSDNEAVGSDSRHFGAVPIHQVLGKVTAVIGGP